MTSENWFRKNCKWAQVLPPRPPQDPELVAMEQKFEASVNALRIIKNSGNSDLAGIEEDRFNPGSQYGHSTATVGQIREHNAELVLKGSVYCPGKLSQSSDFLSIGNISQNIEHSLRENTPSAVREIIEHWGRLERNDYQVVNLTRNGDSYEVVVNCELAGQSDYDPSDRH